MAKLKQPEIKSNQWTYEQERVDELIAFFYDLIRDEPTVLAKVDKAFRQRYGYGDGNEN